MSFDHQPAQEPCPPPSAGRPGCHAFAAEPAAGRPVGSRADGYRELFERHPQPMWVVDRETLAFLAVNEAACRYFGGRDGIPEPGAAGEVDPPEDLVHLLRHLTQVMDLRQTTGPFPAVILRYRPKNGPALVVEVKVSPTAFRGRDAVLVLVNDITGLKHTEEVLRASERRFRTLVENSSDVILLLRPDGTILYDAPCPGRVLGYEDEDFVGRNAFELVHPEDREAVRRELAGLVERPAGPVTAQFRARHRDGSWRWIEAVGANLLADPSVQALVVNYRDITDRKRVEEALRQSQHRFEVLVNTLEGIVWDADPRTSRFTFISRQAERLLGYPCARWLAEPNFWEDHLDPRDRGWAVDFSLRAVAARKPYDLEYRMVAADGRVVWLRDLVTVVCEDDQPVALRGIMLDITERKRAEEDLKRLVRRNELILAAAGEGIYGVDLEGKTTFVNPAAARMFGWTVADMIGKNVHALIHHTRRDGTPHPAEECPIYASFRDGVVHRVADDIFWRHDGTWFPVEYISTPIWEDGELVGAVVTFSDITERKRVEEKLQESAERLRTLSGRLLEVQELERRHLASELHDEIGQVLTGLQLSLAMSLRLDADQLRASVEEAQGLVKDLTARVRDISLRLRPTMLDDLGLLPTLLWHFERYTSQTGVDVFFEHEGLERRLHPREVETAAYRIVQEALTNVARHAGVREATVRIWVDHDLLCVQVQDEGVGFDPRAAAAAATSSGLSGMQERAMLLGGYVVIDSGPGAGTRVTAELPVSGAEERRRANVFDPLLGRRPSDRPSRVESDFGHGAGFTAGR